MGSVPGSRPLGQRHAGGQLELLDPLVIDSKAGLSVNGDRARMVEVAGVHPEPARPRPPGVTDRPVEQIAAEAAADELGQEPEIGELGIGRLAAVELGVARRNAVDPEHVHLHRRIADDLEELLVRQQQAHHPGPLLADRAIEIAVERDGRIAVRTDLDRRRAAGEAAAWPAASSSRDRSPASARWPERKRTWAPSGLDRRVGAAAPFGPGAVVDRDVARAELSAGRAPASQAVTPEPQRRDDRPSLDRCRRRGTPAQLAAAAAACRRGIGHSPNGRFIDAAGCGRRAGPRAARARAPAKRPGGARVDHLLAACVAMLRLIVARDRAPAGCSRAR